MNETFSKYGPIIGGVIILLVIIGVVFMVLSPKENVLDDENTTLQEFDGIAQEEAVINEIPLETKGLDAPTLRGIQFEDTVPEEVRVLLSGQYAEVAGRLELDKSRAEDWYTLAVLYKTASDFKGARDVWEFLISASPNDTLAYDNLGKLYHYDLGEYEKAEQYLQDSIAIDNVSLAPYLELYTLYRYSYKTDTARAFEVLKEGLVALPNELALYMTLADYHEGEGDIEEARTTLSNGLLKAQTLKNVEFEEMFTQALKNSSE